MAKLLPRHMEIIAEIDKQVQSPKSLVYLLLLLLLEQNVSIAHV